MKQILLALAYLVFGAINVSQAQNVLNPSFDSVYFGGIDRLFSWVTSDGIRMASGSNWNDTVYGMAPDSSYAAPGFMFHELLWLNNKSDTSSYSIASTVIINRPRFRKTNGEVYPGFVINGNHFVTDQLGYPDLSKCGIPFNARPTKLTGLYHFVDSTTTLNNFGKAIVLLTKWNVTTQQRDTIAFAESTAELNPNSGFQPFEINLNYLSALNPDTLMVAFFASSIPEQPAALWLDELSFAYSGISVVENSEPIIVVYPNPAHDYVRIAVSGKRPEGFEIIDLTGKVLRAGNFQTQIDISRLRSDVLFLRLIWANGNSKYYQIANIKEAIPTH